MAFEKINYADEARREWNSYIKRHLMNGQRMEMNAKDILSNLKAYYIAQGYRIEGSFAIKGEEPVRTATSKEEKKKILGRLKWEYFTKNSNAPASISRFEKGIKSGEYRIDDLPSANLWNRAG